MLSEPCKVCGEPVDMPKSKFCRKCFYAHKKALPSYKKYLQKKAWKDQPSYKKNLQEKAWKNWPSYQKYIQEKTWKNTAKYQNKVWTTYPRTCEACGATYEAYHKYSRLCPVCYARQQELKTASTTRGQYKHITIDGRQIKEHRYLAEQIFGRVLTPDENVHHLDEDPLNNDLSNLIVLSHSNHISLHHYLDVQQVVEEKQGNPKPWSELVAPLSMQWLRVNKVPYLQLSELKAFKDQLIKQSKIGSRPEAVRYIMEDRISQRLYPKPVRIIAEIPENLIEANGD